MYKNIFESSVNIIPWIFFSIMDIVHVYDQEKKPLKPVWK